MISQRGSSIRRDRVVELLDYYPDSGDFVWKVSLGGHRIAGRQAGCLDGGKYVQIQIDKQIYKAHRLAWLVSHGEWPSGDLDHRNCNRADNRICNLRVCSNSENHANRMVQRNNKSGMKGVSWHRATQKWVAQICVNWKVNHLGLYDDLEKAKAAYDAAARLHFGEFARPG